MRKLNSLVLFIAVFSILFNITSHSNLVFAQQVESAQTEAATDSAKINYDLPFPGILPDNPLYKLKILRDR